MRSFFSDQPVPTPVRYQVELRDPERRDGERRFFSQFTPDGLLVLTFQGNQWAANTLLEIDLVATTPEQRKIALHMPQVRLQENTDVIWLASFLAELLTQALTQRQLVPVGAAAESSNQR